MINNSDSRQNTPSVSSLRSKESPFFPAHNVKTQSVYLIWLLVELAFGANDRRTEDFL